MADMDAVVNGLWEAAAQVGLVRVCALCGCHPQASGVHCADCFNDLADADEARVAALFGAALTSRRGPSSGEPDRWSPDTKEESDE